VGACALFFTPEAPFAVVGQNCSVAVKPEADGHVRLTLGSCGAVFVYEEK